MPLGDQARALLTSALRDPLVVNPIAGEDGSGAGVGLPVVARGAVSGRGHGRKRAELHRLEHSTW